MNNHDGQPQAPLDGESDTPIGAGPELSGSDYVFAEPELESAAISPDVAESVDLESVEAEAAKVEREAETSADLPAAQLVPDMPPLPPVTDMHDAGPAGPAFGSPAVSAAQPVRNAATPTRAESPAPVPDATSGTSSPEPEADTESPDWGEGGETVLRTDFTKAPVANNPWTAPAPPEPVAPVTPAPQPPTAHQEPPATQQPPTVAPISGVTAPSSYGAPGDGASNNTVQEPPVPNAPAYPSHSVDDGSGWRRPETPWQQSATPWQPKANGWQSPRQVAENQAALDAAQEQAHQSEQASQTAIPTAPSHPEQMGQNVSGQSNYGQLPPNPYAPPTTQAPFGTPPPYPAYPAHPGGPPPTAAPAGYANGPVGVPGAPAAPEGQPGAVAPNYTAGAYGFPGSPNGPAGPGGPQYPNIPYGAPQQYPGGPQGGPPKSGNAKIFIILGAVVVAVVLLGLVIVLILGLISNASKNHASDPLSPQPNSSATQKADADGVIQDQVDALDWKLGDCLGTFVDVSTPADVVLCSIPHQAQLVATYYYPSDAKFPGRDALSAKGNSLCDAVKLNGPSKNLDRTVAYPSSDTWDNDSDRRVDCIVAAPAGETLSQSLVK